MKKQFLLFGLLIIALFSACKKETYNDTKQAVIDEEKIQAYIKANHINVTKASSGIYYQILRDTGGLHPNDTSHVQVGYTGKLLNGASFDSSPSSIIALNDAVKGWEVGLPLVGLGGRIRLIIPSSLGYGSVDQTNIPPNSVLDFTIDLLGFY